MINFDSFQLSNGLKVIHHKDVSSPVAAFNLLYDVGARDENPNRTGFAHLFEHLMFGGSANIPDFDLHLQLELRFSLDRLQLLINSFQYQLLMFQIIAYHLRLICEYLFQHSRL